MSSSASMGKYVGFPILLSVLSFLFWSLQPQASFARFYQTKSKFHSKQWIQYFPQLKKMETLFFNMKAFPSPDEITSANNTTVSIITEGKLRKGSTLEVFIQARDRLNRMKKYGGDALRAVLYRTEGDDLNDGVSCKIQDNDNGSYKAFCPLLWTGEARLKVILVHPSESIYMLMLNTTRLREEGTHFIATVKNGSKGRTEEVLCGLGFSDILSDSDVCNYSNPRNGEPWFCLKPSWGICSPILTMKCVYDDRKQKKHLITQGPYYVIGENFATDVTVPDIHIEVLDQDQNRTRNDERLPMCYGKTNLNVTFDPNAPTGWFHNGQWKSFSCENRPYHPEKFAKCLTNYTLYFIGDSTIRFFYGLLANQFNASVKVMIGKTTEWSRPRNGYESKNNITLYYRAHGPPLHNPGTPEVRPYITDTLDSINSTISPAIVLLNIDLHMHLFDPDFYLHRIRGIRKGIVNLKSRNPKIQIFIKGSHFYRQLRLRIPTMWFSNLHDVLVRNVLGTIEGVTYIPYWDMTSVLNNELVHAVENVLIHQMGMLQSLICEK